MCTCLLPLIHAAGVSFCCNTALGFCWDVYMFSCLNFLEQNFIKYNIMAGIMYLQGVHFVPFNTRTQSTHHRANRGGTDFWNINDHLNVPCNVPPQKLWNVFQCRLFRKKCSWSGKSFSYSCLPLLLSSVEWRQLMSWSNNVAVEL